MWHSFNEEGKLISLIIEFMYKNAILNDPHREQLFYSIITRMAVWLLLRFSCVYTINYILYISLHVLKEYRYLKNVIH